MGDGVATPALVGDKLYVFSRQEGNEVIRCLDALVLGLQMSGQQLCVALVQSQFPCDNRNKIDTEGLPDVY